MNASSTHCPSCGIPIDGSICTACGSSGEGLALLDGEGDLPVFPADTSRPELEWAGEAWTRGEYARVVSHCLSAEGAQGIKSRTVPEGPAFVAVMNGVSVIIRVQEQRGEIVVETPVARLPRTQYVGAMRAALELSASTRSPARYNARGEILLLRSVGRLASTTPPVLQWTLRALVAAAIDDAKVLSTSVQARAFTSQEHVHLDLDSIPDDRPLDLGESRRPPSKKPTIPAEPPREFSPTPNPFSGAALSAPPVPAAFAEPAPNPALKATAVSPGMAAIPARSASMHKMPAVKKPSDRAFPAIPPIAPTSAPITPTHPGAGASALKSGLRPPASSAPAASAPVPTKPAASPAAPAPKPALRRPSASIVVTANAAPAAQPSPTQDTPQAALGELLHKAQTLGAMLSFADQPASMALLIRASVYRTLLEFDATLPAAVSLLWTETQPLTKEIYITAPGIRRGAMAIPSANRAFEVMQQIVDARGDVQRAETPQITPITTSQEAKQHLARYVSEIDQAPKDLELRHFLALGALSELLVRAKLPGPTLERLRGIIGHAKRDGATQPVVDLMMTALSRMMA
ncbi:MAG: hypothetical protein U0414_30245 [Polyangiaceae bacterium]